MRIVKGPSLIDIGPNPSSLVRAVGKHLLFFCFIQWISIICNLCELNKQLPYSHLQNYQKVEAKTIFMLTLWLKSVYISNKKRSIKTYKVTMLPLLIYPLFLSIRVLYWTDTDSVISVEIICAIPRPNFSYCHSIFSIER